MRYTENQIKQLTKEAENGSWLAQFALGEHYYDEEDYTTALTWYEKSAEQGYAEAQNKLGYCYHKAKGVVNQGATWLGNIQTAMEWYRKAAEQGLAEAQKNLADCYYKEWRLPHDDEKAVYWYRRAAEQGHAEAQFMLGVCYGCGRGVPEDDEKAEEWKEVARENGYNPSDSNSTLRALDKVIYKLGFEEFSKLLD